MIGIESLGKGARRQRENTDNLRRQNNVLFESYKNITIITTKIICDMYIISN